MSIPRLIMINYLTYNPLHKMNITISITETTKKSIQATILTGPGIPAVNVGTIWMTRDEFDNFTSILTFGIPEGSELIIDSPEEGNTYIGK